MTARDLPPPIAAAPTATAGSTPLPSENAGASPALATLAFALLAGGLDTADGAEAGWLMAQARRLGADAAAATADPPALLARWHADPPQSDRRLRDLARELPLADAETLALALACAAETDAMAARALAWLQAPVGGGRPTAGLVARLAEAFGDAAALASLATGPARESGLLRIADEARPLPEATLTVPQPIVFALADPPRLHWPGLDFLRSAAAPASARGSHGTRDARSTRDSRAIGHDADDRDADGTDDSLPLPPSLRAAAAAHARALRGRGGDGEGARHGGDGAAAGRDGCLRGPSDAAPVATPRSSDSRAGALLIRAGDPRESRVAAAEVAAALGARPVYLEGGEAPPGFGAWLQLAGAVPVLRVELAPGERRRIAEIACWSGPILVVAGPDGSAEFRGESVPAWRVPTPPAAERQALWRLALEGREPASSSAVGAEGATAGAAAPAPAPPPPAAAGAASTATATANATAALADRLGRDHRHGAGRIAELGRAARFEMRLADADALGAEHVARAARGGAAGDAGALAELVADEIPDAALVLPPAVRAELEALATRCLARDGAADGLGPAIRARFRPGVRALFVGPSGTGKSLAVGWLATRLGLPLYRVDLASVSSKYIGETEKNLAQLFARAEHAELVLMFDEADALFGKRTEVKDSNDRFANAQTNYLLTRIESYEGIAVLTSNSRARFDSAFTRRLDTIVEFPAPLPQERRALWAAHLGEEGGAAVGGAELNRLAVGCDLAGGHIRNIVLAAAAAARREGRPIGYGDIVQAIVAECRKLGRQPPHGLL